jgi:hypothetical protein
LLTIALAVLWLTACGSKKPECFECGLSKEDTKQEPLASIEADAATAKATVDRWIAALAARNDDDAKALASSELRVFLVSVDQLENYVIAFGFTDRDKIASTLPSDFFRFPSDDDGDPPDPRTAPAELRQWIVDFGAADAPDQSCAEDSEPDCDDEAPDHSAQLAAHAKAHAELSKRVAERQLSTHRRYNNGGVWDDDCLIVTTKDGGLIDRMLCVRSTWDSGD